MGWSIGYDENWKRDIGYGVPATCDYPECGAKIDRGLSYVCGNAPMGGDKGCGLYFCDKHLSSKMRCARCERRKAPFLPTNDVPEWVQHKLTDESWQRWRDENPREVAALLSNAEVSGLRSKSA